MPVSAQWETKQLVRQPEPVADEKQMNLTPIREATFIVRLWTDGKPGDDNAWRGTAEHIGSGQSHQFRTIDDFIDWLRQELKRTEEQPES